MDLKNVTANLPARSAYAPQPVRSFSVDVRSGGKAQLDIYEEPHPTQG
jgi:hypothetical protein